MAMNKLKSLLNKASDEELNALARILGCDEEPDDIIRQFRYCANGLVDWVVGRQPSYRQIVCEVADEMSVEFGESTSVGKIEMRLAQAFVKRIWWKSTPTQRKALEREWMKAVRKFDKGGELVGSVSIFAALTVAQLSGFGVYLLASTALAAMSGLIGVALPFAIYTTMSTAIGVIIGPVGWLGAGLLAAWKLMGPNYKKLVPAILYVSMLRNSQRR